LISVIGILWVNTGHNSEAGFTYCGGGGFIPAYTLGRNNPGGPCLGNSVTEAVPGRYQDSPFIELVLGTIGGFSLLVFLLMVLKQHKPLYFKNPYFFFVVIPVLLGVIGILFDVFISGEIAGNVSLAFSSSTSFISFIFILFLSDIAILPTVVLLIMGLVKGIKLKKPILISLIALIFVVLAFAVYVFSDTTVVVENFTGRNGITTTNVN
jgi:hypothetical protein